MKLISWLLVLVLLIGGTIDLPRKFDFGLITAMGLLTIFYTATSWLLVLSHAQIPKAAWTVSWFVLFLAWPLVTLKWHPANFGGAQNLITFSAFAGLLCLSAIGSYQSPYLSKHVGSALGWATQLAVVLSGLSLIRETGIIQDSFTENFAVGMRGFAMFALMGLGWYLAKWRYGSRSGLWWAIIVTLMIGLSLSRMSLLIAFALFPLTMIQLNRARGWMKMGLCIALISGISYLAFTYVEPIRSRFISGDTALQIGGVGINVSGRSVLWRAALASFWESPWTGKGAGSVQDVVAASFPSTQEIQSHPHNDYIRLLHDYGLIGLVLWLLGFGGLLIATCRAWLWAGRNQTPQAQLHLAAFLALVSTAMMMWTDNIIVYTHVMAPLGVLVGASLGTLSRERAQAMIRPAEKYTTTLYSRGGKTLALNNGLPLGR